jgi:uncharacterized protein
MNKLLTLAVLALAVSTASAQTAPAPAATPAAPAMSAAKRDLVARIVRLQQPGVENMGQTLAAQPAQQLMGQVQGIIGNLPADKREGVAREVEGDLRKYADEAVPIVRAAAVRIAPATIGPILAERFSEDELRQIVTMLESPLNAKFQAAAADMQRALGAKIIDETRGTIEPKVQALRQSVTNRLNAAAPRGN